jgi:uncharacterized flavoprotein (TIGR03862 family)
MKSRAAKSLAVIGGGPAGLMAAEVACAAGLQVDVFDAMGSVGRKFLLAGKGGLNLTHSEPFAQFVLRYGARHADALREWARGFGVNTFIGSSGRVFPNDLKAAPLLRGWVRRLRESGVRFHVHHRCIGWHDRGALRFSSTDGERLVAVNAVILAMGGGSWPELGSDGAWQTWLRDMLVDIAPLQPSNCGFELNWSEHFSSRHAGHPLKSVRVSFVDHHGQHYSRLGEFIITAKGVEGSLIYALSAPLRDTITAQGTVETRVDLAPDRDLERLIRDLARPRGDRSVATHLRRCVGIDGAKASLLYEVVPKADFSDAHKLATWIKSLPLVLQRPRPISEAISSAGGVKFAALDKNLMLRTHPGIFCAGEMIDWEAPTGGYLLTACFASGRMAGLGAVDWLIRQADA